MQKSGKRHAIIALAAQFLGYVAAFGAMWWIFRESIFDDAPSAIGTLSKGIAEGALLFCPFWLLPPRWRWLASVALWATALFFFANALYFRVFDDIIPFSQLFLFDNFNARFFSSGLALFEWRDIAIFAPPALLDAALAMTRRKLRAPNQSVGWRTRAIAIGICLCVWMANQAIYIRSEYCSPLGITADTNKAAHEKSKLARAVAVHFSAPNYVSRMGDLHARGWCLYCMREVARTLRTSTSRIALSKEEREGIVAFLQAEGGREYALPPAFAHNASKNVVLVIVESLNSFVVGLDVNGKPVCPTLNALVNDSSCVSALGVVPQVKDGGSSDGQLIYDTGLLPMKRGAAATMHATNTFPSLAQSMGRAHSLMFIADSRRVWNYDTSASNYGYSRLYDIADLEAAGLSPDVLGSDKAVFTFAAQTLRDTPQPFFAEIITMSMHLPFREAATPRIAAFEQDSEISSTLRDYITSVRYFDDCLAEFIANLKNDGIYDNTIIFIASDHDIMVQNNNAEMTQGDAIAFFAVNAGAHMSIEKTIGQIDIHPTILDISGHSAAPWRGIGRSAFNPECAGAADGTYRLRGEAADPHRLLRMWDINDSIIRGDYFAPMP